MQFSSKTFMAGQIVCGVILFLSVGFYFGQLLAKHNIDLTGSGIFPGIFVVSSMLFGNFSLKRNKRKEKEL